MDNSAPLDRRPDESPSSWGVRLLDALAMRLCGGGPAAVEWFLEHVRGLGDEHEIVLDLIVAEWTLRRQAGEIVDIAEYTGRFAALEPELRAHWEVDRETPWSPGANHPGSGPRFPGWYVGTAALPVDFGPYRLLREFGGGGMARVFLADPRDGGERLALKVPKLPAEHDPESSDDRNRRRDRFLREAGLARQLTHPRICRALDVGECEGLPYFTMHYYPDGSIREELDRRGKFGEAEAAGLVAEVAHAMQSVHDLGAVHRDLKPSNLLRDGTGGTVVADFGLAVLIDVDWLRLTQTGATPGTPHYFSPEQAADVRDLTSSSDIFSLGVILYELLAGGRPFGSANVLALLNEIAAASPRPLEELRPGIAPALAAIVRKAMAREPGGRYPSMHALATDLERFLAGVWTPEPEATDPPAPTVTDPGLRRRETRRRWLRAALVAALVFLLGGTTLWAILARKGLATPSRAVQSRRVPVGHIGLLRSLHDDLTRLDAPVRSHMRYFSLMAVHDNPYVSDDDLATHLDTLRRVLNRLSHNVRDVPIYPVDASGSLLRVDLRDLGWDAAYEWRDILAAEPYGVRYDAADQPDASLRKLAHETYDLTTTLDAPSVRGDWFIDGATRAPLYDRLLGTDLKGRRTVAFDTSKPDDVLTRVVALYRAPVDLTTAAAEVGLETAAVLEKAWPRDRSELLKDIKQEVSRERWAGEAGIPLFAGDIRLLSLGVPSPEPSVTPGSFS